MLIKRGMRKSVCLLLVLLTISIGVSAYIYKTSTDRIRLYEGKIGEYKRSLERVTRLYADLASRYANLSGEHKELIEMYENLRKELKESVKYIAFLKSRNEELESQLLTLKKLEGVSESLPVSVVKVSVFLDKASGGDYKYWVENITIAYYDSYLLKYIALVSDNKRYELGTEPYEYLTLEVPLYKQGTKLLIRYVFAFGVIPKVEAGAYIVDVSYVPRKAEIIINNNTILYIGNTVHGS